MKVAVRSIGAVRCGVQAFTRVEIALVVCRKTDKGFATKGVVAPT